MNSMIAVIVIETWRTGNIPAVDTIDETGMVMTESGWTVNKMNQHLWSYYMDWTRTSKKRM